MVKMSTSSTLNLLSVMFASEVELASLHDRLGPGASHDLVDI